MKPKVDNLKLRERIEFTFPVYLKGYRDRVEKLYSSEHEVSEYFSLMSPIKLIVLLKNYFTHVIFVKSEVDSIEIMDCTCYSENEMAVLVDGPPKLKADFLNNKFNIVHYLEIMRYFEFINKIMLSTKENLNDFAYREGCQKADSHNLAYTFSLAVKEVVKPTIKTSVLNTDEIIEKVNDLSFQYEFGESVKSYNCELYFAAASAGGGSLENILRILITRKLGEEYLTENTYIITSLNTLKKHNIVKGRLYARIKAFNAIRNSNAHTNEDPVEKEVVEDLFRIIRDVSLLF